jgi:choline kinase
VENTRYAETNSLYSLWLARPLLYGGCIVLNGDVPFPLFAGRHPLWAIGTPGFPGIEVDSSEDYERAIAEILPQIDDIPAVGADPVAPPMTAGAASR